MMLRIYLILAIAALSLFSWAQIKGRPAFVFGPSAVVGRTGGTAPMGSAIYHK